MENRSDALAPFQNACRRAGLRLTPQRLAIFRELAASTDHPTVEELQRRLLGRFPTLSLDTVYRTLGTLSRYGLAHKMETAERHARYEVRGSPHHHLICRNCKEIVDFKWTSFDQAALPDEVRAWGRIEERNAVVYGLCRHCQAGNDPACAATT